MTTWVRIKSWHIAENGKTRCGRAYVIPSPTTDDPPLDEKSCEKCATLVLHDQGNAEWSAALVAQA
jgi:hypothetical protein